MQIRDLFRLAGASASASILVLAAVPADAVEPGQTPWCAKEPGLIQGPYVPTRRAAIRIYLAVRREIAPRQAREFNIPMVLDNGDTWGVYYTKREFRPRIVKRQNGDELIVSAGGGMLTMDIDKCSGRITKLYYAK